MEILRKCKHCNTKYIDMEYCIYDDLEAGYVCLNCTILKQKELQKELEKNKVKNSYNFRDIQYDLKHYKELEKKILDQIEIVLDLDNEQ